MKTIILVFLLSVMAFGQSGKSNLTQQQKDSIAAIVKDSLDNKVGWTSAKEYGAVSDGTTDNTAVLESIVDGLNAGDVLYFPTGAYKISSTWIIDKQISLKGDAGYTFQSAYPSVNKGTVFIIDTPSDTGIIYRPSSYSYGGVEISGIALYDVNANASAALVIDKVNIGIRIINCSIDNFRSGTGIVIGSNSGGILHNIFDCYVTRTMNGVHIKNGAVGNIWGGWYEGYDTTNTGTAFIIENGGWKIGNLAIDNMRGAFKIIEANQNTITNIRFENDAYNDTAVSFIGDCQMNRIIDNDFALAKYGLIKDGTGDVIKSYVSGNLFQSAQGDAVTNIGNDENYIEHFNPSTNNITIGGTTLRTPKEYYFENYTLGMDSLKIPETQTQLSTSTQDDRIFRTKGTQSFSSDTIYVVNSTNAGAMAWHSDTYKEYYQDIRLDTLPLANTYIPLFYTDRDSVNIRYWIGMVEYEYSGVEDSLVFNIYYRGNPQSGGVDSLWDVAKTMHYGTSAFGGTAFDNQVIPINNWVYLVIHHKRGGAHGLIHLRYWRSWL